MRIQKITFISIVFLFFANLIFSQENIPIDYYDDAPDNFRRVGTLNLVVRHAFPSKVIVPPYLSRNPNRQMIVDGELLAF